MPRLGLALVAVSVVSLLAGGCTAPDHSSNAVSVKWSVSPDDPCGKIAGAVALADLFNFQSPPDGPDFYDMMTSELEQRCPPDTQPEAFDLDVYIGTGACAEIQGLLDMALFFDVTVFVVPERRKMIDDLVAALEGEVEKRCK